MASPSVKQQKSPTQEAATDFKKAVDKEASSAKRVLGDANDAVRDKASKLASEAKEAAKSEAIAAKDAASGSLHDFADAVRTAGNQLAESDQSMASDLVREAASGLETLSASLDKKKLPEILNDVRNFGRQNPTAFIAGSVLIGLALGRFVKSTESESGGTANTPRENRAPSGKSPMTRVSSSDMSAKPASVSGRKL